MRIGDSWNAITIIALSQSNPLKAVAEFVECKLFAKELVSLNFPGASAADLLERIIELSLYTEENLK